jgi:toxin-antitoxin system PIN domain toxin
LILIDVNVLVYALHPYAPEHDRYRAWLNGVVADDAPFGLSELVLGAFIRIATHPRISSPPASVARAFELAADLRGAPNAVVVAPGPRHWSIFERLCRGANARGSLVTDAYFAALAIESGSEWVTTDRDYARFPGLRWRHPLEA